mmetsp:Transcript_11126/g.15145  ORF Transcript_11126/g.15145 Transcript_11126/m.15145 type:complete len:223 (+) Transcript_11126:10-678(+)
MPILDMRVIKDTELKLQETRYTQIVSRTWIELTPHVAKFPFIFYNKFWEIDPTTKPLFAGKAIKTQGDKLVKLFQMVVDGLEDLDTLRPTLEMLARKHVAVGVQPGMFEPLGIALIGTLEQLLGKRFTQEVREAWSYVYNNLADKMKLVVEEEYNKMHKKEISKTHSEPEAATETNGTKSAPKEETHQAHGEADHIAAVVEQNNAKEGKFWAHFHLCKFSLS